MAWGKVWSGWKLFQGDAAVAWGAERFIAESKRGGGQISSVQLLESRGNSAQQGKDGFCKHIMCRMWKPSIVPMSTSKPEFSLLEAPGVSVWRPKTHVFVVAGALPCSLCLFASRAFLHLCIPGISVSLHPGHLRTPGISESVSWASLHPGHLHLCIPASQVRRQPGRRAGVQPPQLSWGAAGCLPGQQSPPALRCYRFSLKV